MTGGTIVPRSLSQAGIDETPFWVKTEHIENQPFYIYGATIRESRFGGEEVAFTARLRDGVYDFEGNLHHKVWFSLKSSDGGQRAAMATYFESNTDPLGPLVIERVPTDNGTGNDFIKMVDTTREAMALMPVEPRQVGQRLAVLDSETGEALADLPF